MYIYSFIEALNHTKVECLHSNAEGCGICSHEFQTLLTLSLAMMWSIVTEPPSQESQLNIRTRENHNEPWRILYTLRPILPPPHTYKSTSNQDGETQSFSTTTVMPDSIHLILCLPLSRNETNVSQGGVTNSTV